MAKPTRAEKKAAKLAAKQAQSNKKNINPIVNPTINNEDVELEKQIPEKTTRDRVKQAAKYLSFPPLLLWDALQGRVTHAQEQRTAERGTTPLQNIAGGVKEFAAGVPAQQLKFELLTPEQKAAYSQNILPYLLNQIGAAQGTTLEDYAKGFQPFENQARQDFAQKTIPSISERFSGMGAGAQRSSAFPQLLSQAGKDLETNLAAQRAQFGLQNREALQRNALGLIGFGLQPQIENAYIPRQPGAIENILAGGAGGLGKAAGMALFGGL